VRQF
jgi:uncharacterized protein (DUF1919 family)